MIQRQRPVLQPLVERHRALVSDALRALLGIPASIPLVWHQKGAWTSDGWVFHLQVGEDDAPVGLVLSAAAVGQAAAYRGPRLHLAHRSAAIHDSAIWRALTRRLQSLEAQDDPLLLTALTDAMRVFAPFSRRDDGDFRSFDAGEGLLRLGFRCNQDCSFCWQGRDWPTPDIETLRSWLDAMAASGGRRLVLSGGEPTVYLEPLLELARRATEVHGLAVFVQTNAIRLGQPRILQALHDAGIRGALVSYHSADAAISDAMTRAPGTHQRTEVGIVAALQMGWHVDLNAVVEQRTLPGLIARSERILERFVPHRGDASKLTTAYAFPTDYHDPNVYSQEVSPLDQVAPTLKAAMLVLQAADVAVAPIGTCGFPLCVLAEIPSAIDLSVLDALANDHHRSRVYPPICDTCALRGACIGPRREYLERHGETGLRPYEALPPTLADEVRRRGLDDVDRRRRHAS